MDCFPQIRQGLWKRKEKDQKKLTNKNSIAIIKAKKTFQQEKLGHEEKMDNRDCGGGDGGSLCTGIFRL